MNGKVYKIYFSPTHNTKKLINKVGNTIKNNLDKNELDINLTFPEGRGKKYILNKNDILLYGFPVYAGRMPVLLERELGNLQGENTLAIIIATYGNREYDDAILEAYNILSGKGFNVIAVGAFIGEHSYTKKVATNRPDEKDIDKAISFGEKVCSKIQNKELTSVKVKGSLPYKERRLMPFKPKTNDDCINCGKCINVCPMNIVDKDDPKIVEEGCILCCACIKICPVNAKYINDEPIKNIVSMLESKCIKRKEIEIFI